MALKLYHDINCEQEVNDMNPDLVRQAVQSGEDLINIKEFWIKSDNASLTYENISMTAVNDTDTPSPGQIDIKYSLDGETYSDNITIANSDFLTAVKVWRRMYTPTVTAAFNTTDILHQITADEYVK